MKSLEDYYVYDLLNESESVIHVKEEQLDTLWPKGYFEYTDSLYNRKAVRVQPSETKKHGGFEHAQYINYGDQIPQYRVYVEAGTQLLPYVNQIKGQHVLDVGCGYGDLAFALERLGAASVTALDVHQENIDVCNKIKQNFNSKITFETRDVNDLDVEYLSRFNTVMAFNSLSWANCHIEFIKNTNKALVKNLIIVHNIRGLPMIDCVNDVLYNIKTPLLELVYDEGYHYGGVGWEDNKMCLKAQTNLPFWTTTLDYFGWYIQDWSWQKNCTFNKQLINLGTYAKKFVFNCVNTNQGQQRP